MDKLKDKKKTGVRVDILLEKWGISKLVTATEIIIKFQALESGRDNTMNSSYEDYVVK